MDSHFFLLTNCFLVCFETCIEENLPALITVLAAVMA